MRPPKFVQHASLKFKRRLGCYSERDGQFGIVRCPSVLDEPRHYRVIHPAKGLFVGHSAPPKSIA